MADPDGIEDSVGWASIVVMREHGGEVVICDWIYRYVLLMT